MKALFAGTCWICGHGFKKDEEINYERAAKKASHAYCFDSGTETAEDIADRLGYRNHADLLALLRQRMSKL